MEPTTTTTNWEISQAAHRKEKEDARLGNVALAEAIALALGDGWTGTPTKLYEEEGDEFQTGAELRHVNGIVLDVHKSKRTGQTTRIHVSLCWRTVMHGNQRLATRNLMSYAEDKATPPTFTTEISVSDMKMTDAIARDITRRLLPSCVELQKRAQAYVDRENDTKRLRHATADALARYTTEVRGERDGAITLTANAWIDPFISHKGIVVHHDAHVEFTITAPADVAAAVLALLEQRAR